MGAYMKKGRILEVAPNPSPGISPGIKVDIRDYQKIKCPLLIYNCGYKKIKDTRLLVLYIYIYIYIYKTAVLFFFGGGGEGSNSPFSSVCFFGFF